MPAPQTVRFTFDVGQMDGFNPEWSTMRKNIDTDGALGVADGFGKLAIRINDHLALTLHVHEDRQHQVVVDMLNHRGDIVGRVYPEADGYVPPRTVKARTA